MGPAAGFSVEEILGWTGGQLVNAEALGSAAAAIRVERPAPLAGSRASDACFFFSKEYEQEVPRAAPGVLITGTAFAGPLKAAGEQGLPLWRKSAVIACEDPYLALAVLSGKFASRLSGVAHLEAPSRGSIHPSALVSEGAELGANVRIGAHCVVEAGARVGANTVLYPGCYVGPGAVLGEGCVLFPKVTVYEWVRIGDRARIHAGAVLGADGFGFAPIREGGKVVGHQKIFHLGKVIIGDDVEIGANTCVDRGTLGDTVIGSNSKLDNQVQVGHNVTLGEGTVLCGCSAMAGSSSTGRYVYVGGLTGVSNKVHVGDGAQVGALSLVTRDVPPGGTAVGHPQREYTEHFRAHAILNRLVAERSKRSKS